MSKSPRQIDEKYDVVRPLGAGGMGSVYEARHRGTGRRVAVKLILDESATSEGMVARFQREARAAGAIDSEHITQVLDSGTDRVTGTPYLVMELLSGEDVEHLESRLGPLRPDLALRIVSQALRGLERAHQADVIHRDIKPANIFLAKKDGVYSIKICDFGIAKVGADALSSSQNVALTQTSALLGSPRYMSPEQAKGSKTLDARADVWSMGVVLYQLLTGSTPHREADTLGLLLLAICSGPPPSVQNEAPWVSPEIATVVASALRLDARDRYASAGAMLDAVRALLPAGDAIDESMFTPMVDDERAIVAEVAPPVSGPSSLASTMKEGSGGGGPKARDGSPQAGSGSNSAAAPIVPVLPVSGDAVPSGTGGAYSRSRPGVAKPGASRVVSWVVALAVLAGAGVVAVRWIGGHDRGADGERAALSASAPSATAAEPAVNVAIAPPPPADTDGQAAPPASPAPIALSVPSALSAVLSARVASPAPPASAARASSAASVRPPRPNVGSAPAPSSAAARPTPSAASSEQISREFR